MMSKECTMMLPRKQLWNVNYIQNTENSTVKKKVIYIYIYMNKYSPLTLTN